MDTCQKTRSRVIVRIAASERTVVIEAVSGKLKIPGGRRLLNYGGTAVVIAPLGLLQLIRVFNKRQISNRIILCVNANSVYSMEPAIHIRNKLKQTTRNTDQGIQAFILTITREPRNISINNTSCVSRRTTNPILISFKNST